MKRILILTLSVIMLVSALCVPSFAATSGDVNELPFVPASASDARECFEAKMRQLDQSVSERSDNTYILPEMTCNGEETADVLLLSSVSLLSDDSCSHEWLNGVCDLCGLTCSHPTYSSGSCDVCGYNCEHTGGKTWTNNSDDYRHDISEKCDVCGNWTNDLYGEHTYDGITCTVCGYTCTHGSVTSGTCGYCGYVLSGDSGEVAECEYHSYQNGTCTVCGHVCEHKVLGDMYTTDEAYYDGYYCSYNCGGYNYEYVATPHTYVDGVCTTCSYTCSHSSKSEDNVCEYCGTDFNPAQPIIPAPAPTISAKDEYSPSFGSLVTLLGGAAAIFAIIYAVFLLKRKVR